MLAKILSGRRGLALVVILIAAAVLRLDIALNHLPDWDEDNYLIPAAELRRAIGAGDLGGLGRVEQNYEHPPLVKILYGLTIHPAELDDISRQIDQPDSMAGTARSLRRARLLSVAAGLLTVLALACLDPLAGLVLALSTLHVYFSGIAILDSLPVLLSTLMVISYRRGGRWLWLSGALLGAAVAAKYPYALAGVGILAHAILFRQQPVKRMIGWGILSLLVFYALDPYIWRDPIGQIAHQLAFHADYATSRSHHLLMPVAQLATPRIHMQPREIHFLLPGLVDWLIFLAALPGIVLLGKERSPFALWFLTGLIFLSLWRTQWVEHNMLVAAPYALASSRGIRWLAGKILARLRRNGNWALTFFGD